MITVELSDTEVRARLGAMPEALRKAIRRGVASLAIRLVKRVQEKLAGAVLNERTHHLHDFIHWQMTDDAAGIFATVGTNVVYAKVHEFGLTIDVREHMRRMTVAFGRPVKTPRDIMVRAHKATFPERSFLRSSLREFEPAIRDELAAAVEGEAKT